jgi:hypothetical protein
MIVSRKRAVLIWVGAGAGVLAGALALVLLARHPHFILGAVMAASDDPMKQLPIAGAEVTVTGVPEIAPLYSETSGLFRIPLSWRMQVEQSLMIHVTHPDYQPLDLPYTGANQVYLARLVSRAPPPGPETSVANVVVDYSVRTSSMVNIGSAVKTFEVINDGNEPCNGRKPCSPDGKWKAAIGSAVIDAGPGNEFQNARVTCIAGPCAFTKVEDDITRTAPSRRVKAAALAWSDNATFLLEAEVYRRVASDALRKSYPIIFDRALTFTLPAGAEDLSIEAEIDRTPIVFPLGPRLLLSWADCQLLVNKDQTKICRCELKPTFYFAGEGGHE